MHVLFISYDGLTDPLGQSQVLPYLTGLSGEETQITIISAEKISRYKEGKSRIEKLIEEKNIAWYPIRWNPSPPILSTIRDKNVIHRIARKIHRGNPVDVVHCRGYISALVGRKLKRQLGIPFIFDMRGFFADERVEGGVWNLSNPIYRLVYRYFKQQEKLFFRDADSIVSLTEAGKSIIEEQFSTSSEIHVIPCCADFDHFNPAKYGETERKKLLGTIGFHESDYIVSYLGSLGTWYQLNEMLLFFRELKRIVPESKFLFITGDAPTMIIERARHYDIDINDITIRRSPREDVPLHLAISDANIFFIKPCFSKQASSPTKMGEAMAMGIPLICNKGVGDVEAIVKDTNCGVLVDSGDPATFGEAVTKLTSSKFEPAAIREGARKYYDLSRGIEKYKAIYSQFNDGRICREES